MAEAASTRDEILAVAEGMIRTGGFNAFSTRDVANAVGIKSASVHYYFPTKSDIGVAVAERYTERFLKALGNPASFGGSSKRAITHYIDAFRSSLKGEGKLCLCGVLGAEADGLPTEVVGATRIFFERNLAWLAAALSASQEIGAGAAKAHAAHILASLEGAMILAKTLDDEKAFEAVATSLMRTIDE